MSRRFTEIEGVVRSKGAKSLSFRETNEDHDICIPLSQLENADAVSEGDNYISVSKRFLKKLEEEDRR